MLDNNLYKISNSSQQKAKKKGFGLLMLFKMSYSMPYSWTVPDNLYISLNSTCQKVQRQYHNIRCQVIPVQGTSKNTIWYFIVSGS